MRHRCLRVRIFPGEARLVESRYRIAAANMDVVTAVVRCGHCLCYRHVPLANAGISNTHRAVSYDGFGFVNFAGARPAMVFRPMSIHPPPLIGRNAETPHFSSLRLPWNS